MIPVDEIKIYNVGLVPSCMKNSAFIMVKHSLTAAKPCNFFIFFGIFRFSYRAWNFLYKNVATCAEPVSAHKYLRGGKSDPDEILQDETRMGDLH